MFSTSVVARSKHTSVLVRVRGVQCACWRGLKLRRYKFKILGVTDRCSGCAPRDCRHAQHDGRDGHRAATRQRVENARVEFCALRGASERSEHNVRELAGRVQIEAQSHAKDCKSTLARMRQCTWSEHEKRSTSNCDARAVMNRVSTVEPCYLHFDWGREHCQLMCS